MSEWLRELNSVIVNKTRSYHIVELEINGMIFTCTRNANYVNVYKDKKARRKSIINYTKMPYITDLELKSKLYENMEKVLLAFDKEVDNIKAENKKHEEHVSKHNKLNDELDEKAWNKLSQLLYQD